ncbi:MAG: oligosaccharide flippase family protein [Flavobacteriales bacterium]
MKKSFLINIFLLVFLNLLIKPLWVFIEIELQNKVGTENYGLYFALFNFTLIFNIVLDAGIVNYNNKEIAGNPQLIEKYTNRLIPLRLILGLIYLVLILLSGWALNYDGKAILMLMTLGLNQVLLAMLLYLRSNLQGLHFFKSDSIISITDRLVMAVLVLYVLFTSVNGDFWIEWFIYIQTIGYLLAVLLAAFFLMLHSKIKFRLKLDPAFSIVFLKRCLPYALIGILMMLYSFSDSVLLERMLPDGDEEAGIYAQSFRILMALANFSYLFSLLLLPMFSKMIARKEDLQELLQLSASLLILGSIFIAVSCAAFSDEIIGALYGKTAHSGMTERIAASFGGEVLHLANAGEIAFSANIFVFVILSFIPISALYVYGTLLTAAGEMKWLNTSAAIGVGVCLTGNFILIPIYGALGSAFITLLTQSVVCALQYLWTKKKFNLPFNWMFFLRYLITLTAFGISVCVLKNTSFTWPLQILICISIGFIVAILSKTIPLPGISKLIKRKSS